MIWAVINLNYNYNFIQLLQNGDDELGLNEFMELPSLAEDFVDPQKMKSIHEIMSFTDQNNDNAIQLREFLNAMEYFQEQN